MLPTVAVVKVTVAETAVAALTLLERTIEGVTSRALNMAGKKTPVARSIFVGSTVAVVIETVEAAAAVAELVRPAKLHVITVLAAMDAGWVTVSTRLVVDAMEATPTVRPVQVRADVIVLPKFTPATVTVLILPAVAVVKVTVAVTPVAPLR